MKFPFFASFIVLCILTGYELHKHKNTEEKSNQEFWDREAAANSTRRKPLDNLNYIQIPFDRLPMETLAEDPAIADYQDTLRTLAASPIVNFTGISNTDLKLMYGAPNIDLLSRYDQCYTVLVRTLQDWGEALFEKGYSKEACQILEFAVETRTDISATYRLLASIYQAKGQTQKIEQLIPVAGELKTSLAGNIVSMLEEFVHPTA